MYWAHFDLKTNQPKTPTSTNTIKNLALGLHEAPHATMGDLGLTAG